MSRFDLAALAKARGKRRDVELKPIAARLSAERNLYRIIAEVLAGGLTHRDAILAAAEAARSPLMQDDVGLDSSMRSFRSTLARLTDLARSTVRRLFGIEAVRYDQAWMRQVNAAAGVDLRGIITQSDLQPDIDLATQANVALISGLTEEVAKLVETTLIDHISAGRSTRDMAKALDEAFGFGKRRAKLIARDQTAKFNGTLARIRQQQAGVDRYIWWTVQDERVRGNPSGRYPNAKPSHWDRQGKTFSWDQPPSDGHPGEPINCRCIARPVLTIT